jgi:hypothetical protein
MLSESNSAAPRSFGSPNNDDDDDEDDEDFNVNQMSGFNAFSSGPSIVGAKSVPAEKKGANKKSGNIFTLSEMNKDDGNDAEDDEKGQAFYAGGSQTR